MNILLINESPIEFDGKDYYAMDSWILFPARMADSFKKKGHTMTLWTPIRRIGNGEKPDARAWKVPLHSLQIHESVPYNSFVSFYKIAPKHFLSWRKTARDFAEKSDCVIVRLPSPILPIIGRAAQKAGTPLMLFICGDIEGQSDRILGSRGLRKKLYSLLAKAWVWQEKQWAKKSRKLFVYSDTLYQRHFDKQSAHKLKLIRTPHLSLTDFEYRSDTCQGKTIRIVRVCWLIPSKGLETLFAAIALLRQSGFNVELKLVGKERDARYRTQLESLAASLGIRPFITFMDWIPFDRIKALYFDSDIQVISSLAEGTPRVILEGASNGLPLVCTTVGGCSTILDDQVNALMIPPGQPEPMAAAIRRIIENPSLRQLLIKNGYELAKRYCFENLGEEIAEDILAGVLLH